MLGDNKIAENAGWDRELLGVELAELTELLEAEDLDITLTGFEASEIDALMVDLDDAGSPDDKVPEVEVFQIRSVTVIVFRSAKHSVRKASNASRLISLDAKANSRCLIAPRP